MIMETIAAGIDYSTGLENRNMETGIHYGVISQNECLQAWADNSEAFYAPCCPSCGNKIAETFQNILEAIEEAENKDAVYHCPSCNEELGQNDFDFAEASSYYIDDDEYSAEAGDDGDIFITRSPYYTRCRYCSPCAPGAGYIMDQDKLGIKTYCFGHDFFEDGKAPYKVYSVKTNRIVKAEEAGNE
jgi:hypothetical protein